MKLLKIILKNTALVSLAIAALSGCQKSYEQELYERYMDDNLDVEETEMIQRGIQQYSVSHRLPKNESVTIRRLAETAYIETVFVDSDVQNYLVSITTSEFGSKNIQELLLANKELLPKDVQKSMELGAKINFSVKAEHEVFYLEPHAEGIIKE